MKKSMNGSINTAIVVLAIGAGLILSLRPWHVYKQQQAATDQQVHDMNQSERSQAELLRREAYARSSIGREEMARNLGYVKPGEHPADGE